ncbi:hypothetical protein D3C75_912680 [compost metagenome]
MYRSITSIGAVSLIRGWFPRISWAGFCTSGFRWTGYTIATSSNSSAIRFTALKILLCGSPMASRRWAVMRIRRLPWAQSSSGWE